MIEIRKNVEPGETPAQITVSMIDQDLKDGISKPEMAIKYGIKPWEVDEMFKHPFLKGRRPSRKKKLSFTFVDDTESLDNGAIIEVNPNQVTLEDAIDEATEEISKAADIIEDVVKEVTTVLAPDGQTTDDLVEELVDMADDEVKESWETEDRDDLEYANTQPNEEELDEDEEDGTFEL